MGRQEDFINQIAPYVVAWRDFFKFGVASAIIAQACLESGYGTSDKAQYNNFFGLKYKGNRVTCNNGKFTSHSKEWDASKGCYVDITCDWYTFADMNTGVEGYYQFINSGNYSMAKIATTPENYLQALKNAGYATSPNYVQNNMRVINQYNLTQYDKEIPGMKPDSPLAQGITVSPNTYGKRPAPPSRITIHHMGCYPSPTAKDQCQRFASPSRKASANYCIGNAGDCWQGLPEDYAPCTSSNKANDLKAITFEVANSSGAPYWTISPEAMNTLVFLLVDICKRRGIKQLIWSDKKSYRVNGVNGCNMTLHCDFASTTCPGPFLKQCMPNIAAIVNGYLAQPGPAPTPSQYTINGVDYSPVFDPEFYRNKYADLNASFGNNYQQLWNHFCQFGMNEFRQASAKFNPQAYKDRYSDLVAAFGDDNPMYYYHYCTCGKAEGRDAT